MPLVLRNVKICTGVPSGVEPNGAKDIWVILVCDGMVSQPARQITPAPATITCSRRSVEVDGKEVRNVRMRYGSLVVTANCIIAVGHEL